MIEIFFIVLRQVFTIRKMFCPCDAHIKHFQHPLVGQGATAGHYFHFIFFLENFYICVSFVSVVFGVSLPQRIVCNNFIEDENITCDL